MDDLLTDEDLQSMFDDAIAPTPPGQWEGAWVDLLDPLPGVGCLLTLTTRAGEARIILRTSTPETKPYRVEQPLCVRLDSRGRVTQLAEWTEELTEYVLSLREG